MVGENTGVVGPDVGDASGDMGIESEVGVGFVVDSGGGVKKSFPNAMRCFSGSRAHS